MPHIKQTEISSGFFAGIADPTWLASVSQKALQWVASGLADTGKLFGQMVDGVGATAKNVVNFFGAWFKDDPLAATAGVVAGVGVGVLLVQGAIALGSVVGGIGGLGGLFRLASAAGILGGVGAAINQVLGNPIGALIGFLVQDVLFLYNFNWQITDEDIDKDVDSKLAAIYSSGGRFLGDAAASLVCGAIPGVALVKMNLSTIHKLWEVIGEQSKNELVNSIGGLVNSIGSFISAKAFAEIFKNGRKWIKMLDKDPTIRGLLSAVNPSLPALIDHWGEKGNKPFVLSQKVEEKIESIGDKNMKAFAQSFYNAAFNSCLEKLLCLSFIV